MCKVRGCWCLILLFISEQGKKNVGKYPKDTSIEEILEEFKCFDSDAQDVLTERVNEARQVKLGVNLVVANASMGEAHVEAVENIRPNPPMTCPKGMTRS